MTSAEILTTIGNGWKMLTIIQKSSTLDIGRVSGIHRGQRIKNTFISQVKVHHVLHNLYEEGGTAPTFLKK